MTKHVVKLNIYELPEINSNPFVQLSGLGVYHTGVEISNVEYAFGGHPHDFSGIYVIPPKNIKSLSLDDTFKFKETKTMGYTEKTDDEIKSIVEQMGNNDWKGIKYHLLHRNCNHFSDAFCKKVCGKSIPEWINKVVLICQQFPGIENQIPKEYLTPVALKQSIKKKNEAKVSAKKSSPKP